MRKNIWFKYGIKYINNGKINYVDNIKYIESIIKRKLKN